MPTDAHNDLVAVMVTYNPSRDVVENLRAVVAECGGVIVVDNGSGDDVCALLSGLPGVQLISLAENLGIATALNRGMERAEELGRRWVVTFDQDSTPEPGMVAAMLATASRSPQEVVVGPRIREAALGGAFRWLRVHPSFPLFFERVPCEERDLERISMVITSGALTSVRNWRNLGGYDERFFIDFVDTDFCLRHLERGGRIAVSSAAGLRHHLGRREQRRLLGVPFNPTHHPAIRHYYIARNRILMMQRHADAAGHWLTFECAAALMWLTRVLLFEQSRGRKLAAMCVGTWHGISECFGPCSERLAKWLKS